MRPDKVWQIFIFQYPSKFTYRSSMQRAMYDAAIVSIATHTVHSAADRRSMHACELTQRGARQTARVAAVSALSDCVETCTRFCWRVNCGKSARAAWSSRAASRSVRAPSGKCCALIGWPACRWEYKRTSNQYVCSLVGGGLGRRHDRLGAWQLKC